MARIFILAFIIKLSVLNAQWLQLGPDAEFSGYSNPSFGYFSLASDLNGNVYVAGNFTNTSSDCSIPFWNGTTWSKIQGLNDQTNGHAIRAIFCDSNLLYTVGSFVNANGKCFLAKWNGSNWTDLGNPTSSQYQSMYDVCGDYSGTIYTAFTTTGTSTSSTNMARWNNGNWLTLPQISGWTYYKAFTSFSADKFGNLYAVGGFTNSSGNYYVAKWDGANWSELGGQNALGATRLIVTVHFDKNGNLFVGGMSTNANSELIISKWDGTAWSTIPCDFARPVESDELISDISSDSGGNIYVSGAGRSKASGNFVVGKWNGVSWAEIKITMQLPIVMSMCTDPAGNLYASGEFKNAAGKNFVAMYPNANTVSIHEQPNNVNDFDVYPNPTSGQLKIVIRNNSSTSRCSAIQIKNVMGGIVLESSDCENTASLDLAGLSAGLYFVSIQINSRWICKRVVKE